jgi:hypothetical protein
MSEPEYDPAYCSHCGRTTPIHDDHPCVVMFGVVYVRCDHCGKSVPYDA